MADWEDAPSAKTSGSSTSSSNWEDAPITALKEKTFDKKIQPTTDVLNRGLVATTLGIPADFGNLAFEGVDYLTKQAGFPTNIASKKPFLGSEYIGEQMEKAGIVSPTRRPVAETVTSLAPAILTGGGALAKAGLTKGAELADILRGTKSAEALNTLKSTAQAEGLAGKTAIEQQAKGTTQAEKANVASLKDIEEAKYATKEKLRTQAETAQKSVDTSLNKISDKPISDEEFGAFVSDQGGKNVKAINAATEKAAIEDIKDPAFDRSRTRTDRIATNPNSAPILENAMADIQQQIADTPVQFRGDLQKRLNTLFGEEIPLSEGELRVEQLKASIDRNYTPKTTKVEPLTLHQAEFLRRWAKDPILRERTGFGSLDDNRMKLTGDTIQRAMEAYEPDVARYIQTYRQGKQAEELALGGRTGEAAIEPFGTKPQNIASSYLDGTKASADKLVNLVGGKKPELIANVRGKIRADLQDLNAEQTQAYLQKNAGLFETFPELKSPVEQLVKDRIQAEKLQRMYGGKNMASARLSEALNATQSAESLVGKTAEKLTGQGSTPQTLQIALEKLENAKGKEIVSVATNIVDSLRKSNLIDETKYQQLLSNIRNVGDSAEKQAELVKTLKRLGFIGAAATGVTGLNYVVRKALGIQ